ncbi:MAG: hypothetical protein RQ751_10285 [Longimicrobiales bacterium]|nr:hypothetical protein [Longimicrobiales bacterium]
MHIRPVVNALAQVGEILDVALALPAAERKRFYADAGAGRHVRHILDHVLALRAGLEAGVLDYNRRNRDAPIERDPQAARRQLEDLVAWLEAEGDLAGPITVLSEIDVDSTRDATLSSTVERELLYIINHTIHHAAYLRLLGEHRGLAFPDHIGLAPATASYMRR